MNLWDKLPDDIQINILSLKRKAEIKDKDLFWYNFGERMKNLRRANSYMKCTCKTKKEGKPFYVLGVILMDIVSEFEEVMFKSYPNWMTNIKGKDPIQIFYGDIDQPVDLTPEELVEELIAIQIHYDLNVRGIVDTGTMVAKRNKNATTRKWVRTWVNHYYEKMIDANFAKINKLLFDTKFI